MYFSRAVENSFIRFWNNCHCIRYTREIEYHFQYQFDEQIYLPMRSSSLKRKTKQEFLFIFWSILSEILKCFEWNHYSLLHRNIFLCNIAMYLVRTSNIQIFFLGLKLNMLFRCELHDSLRSFIRQIAFWMCQYRYYWNEIVLIER